LTIEHILLSVLARITATQLQKFPDKSQGLTRSLQLTKLERLMPMLNDMA
jgi:hypothetical protein